jgi:hypothetical protein
MQPSSGGFFPSIQFFSTEAAAFVMPILFYFLITVFLCGCHVAKQATWQPHKNNTAHQKHMRSTWVPRVFTVIRK